MSFCQGQVVHFMRIAAVGIDVALVAADDLRAHVVHVSDVARASVGVSF